MKNFNFFIFIQALYLSFCSDNLLNNCPYEYNYNNEFCKKITEFMNGGLFINENNYYNLTIITG